MECVPTSAASAARFRASPASDESEASGLPPPSVLGGPPTFLGTAAVLGAGGGAEPSTRPGCEKLSVDDSLPQMLPMLVLS